MKEQKNYQIGNDVNFKRNTEHDAALESLAKAIDYLIENNLIK